MKNNNKVMMRMSQYFSLLISHFSLQEGFTLAELLIVFAIIAILTSLGLASYTSYNSSQTIQSSASDVATMLNTAKSRSLTQVIPTVCGSNPVTGYQVDIIVNARQYTLSAICGGQQVLTTANLPPNVTFVSGSTPSVFFTISTGTVASTATISLTGYSKTKTITVSQTGDVSVN